MLLLLNELKALLFLLLLLLLLFEKAENPPPVPLDANDPKPPLFAEEVPKVEDPKAFEALLLLLLLLLFWPKVLLPNELEPKLDWPKVGFAFGQDIC